MGRWPLGNEDGQWQLFLQVTQAKDAILLGKAVEKLVRFGQQVGVSPEEMISLLDSGISIRGLLAFLASKSSGNA